MGGPAAAVRSQREIPRYLSPEALRDCAPPLFPHLGARALGAAKLRPAVMPVVASEKSELLEPEGQAFEGGGGAQAQAQIQVPVGQ